MVTLEEINALVAMGLNALIEMKSQSANDGDEVLEAFNLFMTKLADLIKKDDVVKSNVSTPEKLRLFTKWLLIHVQSSESPSDELENSLRRVFTIKFSQKPNKQTLFVAPAKVAVDQVVGSELLKDANLIFDIVMGEYVQNHAKITQREFTINDIFTEMVSRNNNYDKSIDVTDSDIVSFTQQYKNSLLRDRMNFDNPKKSADFFLINLLFKKYSHSIDHLHKFTNALTAMIGHAAFANMLKPDNPGLRKFTKIIYDDAFQKTVKKLNGAMLVVMERHRKSLVNCGHN